MFDLAWSEILLIAAVALIVIGPRELPEVLRTLGQWTAKMRSYASEFRSHFDELVREAEIKKMREEWNAQVLANERHTLAHEQLGLENAMLGQGSETPPKPLTNETNSAPEMPPAHQNDDKNAQSSDVSTRDSAAAPGPG